MRWGMMLASAGLLCAMVGLRAVALCGPVTAEGKTCGPIWGTFCPTQGCQKVEGTNTCPDGKSYNAVLQGPAHYLGHCVTPNPPNPGAECTAHCYACSDKKYNVLGPLWICDDKTNLACWVTVDDDEPRCQ